MIEANNTRNPRAANIRPLGTMSAALENANAKGVTARPPARFWMPLPTQRLPLGANCLNRMVPATIDASAPTENRMPTELSEPAEIRCATTMATPAMPNTSPKTLRHVMRSPSSAAASIAVNTGLVLTISAFNPAEIVRSPI